jgi:hypothetical protein
MPVRPGARRVSATAAGGVLASAYWLDPAQSLTVVLINENATAVNVPVSLPELGIESFDVFTSSSGALWKPSTKSAQSLTVTLPAYGVATVYGVAANAPDAGVTDAGVADAGSAGGTGAGIADAGTSGAGASGGTAPPPKTGWRRLLARRRRPGLCAPSSPHREVTAGSARGSLGLDRNSANVSCEGTTQNSTLVW